MTWHLESIGRRLQTVPWQTLKIFWIVEQRSFAAMSQSNTGAVAFVARKAEDLGSMLRVARRAEDLRSMLRVIPGLMPFELICRLGS